MKAFFAAVATEGMKLRRARILWVSVIAFGLAPVMGGVFMVILSSPELAAQSTALSAKAAMFDMQADWPGYLAILTQAMGVGGVLVFGFVASWVFGREYAEGTVKDLLALPVSRSTLLHGKFVVAAAWSLGLALSNLLLGLLIGGWLGLPGWEALRWNHFLATYLTTTLLTLLLSPPVAFFALWGKGYLSPLGFVALTLVFSQVVAATGYGTYFPWSIPGIFSGVAGEYKALLDGWSYGLMAFIALGGYLACLAWWRWADQA